MKKKKWLITALAAILLVFMTAVSIPRVRAELFVRLYGQTIEESLDDGGGVPASDALLLGYKSVNSWEGDAPMTEFLLLTYGDTYYGCYYSSQDVPLGFQNVPAKLIQDGPDHWEWTGEGDNHGATAKLRDHWYYFAASF